MDLPAACRMLNRDKTACGRSAARRRRGKALRECNAAPFCAVPGPVGKGPTLVWAGSRQLAAGAPLAVGGAGLEDSKAAPSGPC